MSKAKRFPIKYTQRDQAILESIERFPLTPDQLCKLSQTFEQPFSDSHSVRRRLRKLVSADLIRANPYAVASFGSSPAYYKLSRSGYRLLHGFDAELPPRRYFEAIGQARHPHTIALTDFLVHLFLDAHREGYEVRHFVRENSVSFETSSGLLRPDAAFQLVAGDRAFNFVIELDNGSERVRSRQDIESIERKIRGYDSHSQSFGAFDPQRYVVLFVTTRCGQRLKHIMSAADNLMSNRQRTLFLGTSLADFLSREHPLHERSFLTQQFKFSSLISGSKTTGSETSVKSAEKVETKLMPTVPVFC